MPSSINGTKNGQAWLYTLICGLNLNNCLWYSSASIVAVVAISIFVVYSMIPYILNKEKLTPKKGLLMAGFVSGVLEIGLFIFMMILAGSKEAPLTKAGIIAYIPLGIISTIGSLLYIIPFLKCEFYMPEIKK